MKRVTIKDVAQYSGYSIATVSLVLNKKDVSIPQSTRDSVMKAAQELNYRPSQLAVSMITKKSKVLGLIIPDNSNEFFAELSKSVEAAARRSGYSLVYGNSGNDAKRDLTYIQMFADHQVDGIIFAKSASLAYGDNQEIVKYMQDCAIPFTMIDRRIPESNACSVVTNNFQGGYLATKHLIELGHTQIGAYTGPKDVASSNERLEGYKEALAEAGIPYREELIVEGNYQLGNEKKAMDVFQSQRVSAVFSFNDLMALGLYREMRLRGVSAPDDLSIVGFDNIMLSDLIDPPLTTVEQPVKEIGKCAVSLLLKLIEGNEIPRKERNQVFEPKLIVRESAAKYKKKGGV